MFAQPFWPKGFFDVVCTDSFIPEFWVTTPPTHSQSQPSGCDPAGTPHSQHIEPESAYSLQAAAQDATSSQHNGQTGRNQSRKSAEEQKQRWTQQQQPQQQQQQEAVYCMVGFVAGSKADQISKLRQNSVVIKTLSQLDEMFGESCMTYGRHRIRLCQWHA